MLSLVVTVQSLNSPLRQNVLRIQLRYLLTPTPQKEEVILSVAGEGGGYTILGEQRQGRWRFWREPGCGDSWMYDEEESAAPPSEEPIREPRIDYCDTLDEVLENINASWPRLRQQKVHPVFAADILGRVTEYFTDKHDLSNSVISRWQEICLGEAPDAVPANLPRS